MTEPPPEPQRRADPPSDGEPAPGDTPADTPRDTPADTAGGPSGEVRGQRAEPAGALDGLTAAFRRAPVTWTLAGLNILAFLLLEAAGGSTDLGVLVRYGAQATALLEEGEWWRLFTATFLHIGALHLVANLWALALFGPLLERLLGPAVYTAAYLASGLAGSAATALFGPQRAVAAGASGAIFGLLGGFAVLGLRLRHNPVGQAWLRQAIVLVVANVALGLSVPSIGLEAHLGGLVAGAVVVAIETVGRVREGRLVIGGGERRWVGLAAAAAVAAAAVGAAVGLVG